MLESTSALTRMVLGESRLARVLRDRILVPSLNVPAVQRLIWEQASQLKISYRSGPLASSAWWPFLPGPRPGDRVPDLPCQRPDGSWTRLHAELGPAWVLLVPPPATRQAALGTQNGPERCIDGARERLGAELVTVLTATDAASSARAPHLLLVRPDGHLGWRGTPSTSALNGWLTSVLDQGHVSPDAPPRSALSGGHCPAGAGSGSICGHALPPWSSTGATRRPAGRRHKRVLAAGVVSP